MPPAAPRRRVSHSSRAWRNMSRINRIVIDVNEYVFRYNHRNDETPMFVTLKARAKAVRAGKHGDYAPLGAIPTISPEG